MTVTGHIEQLRLSACYQKSPGLTCLSCHDPHAREGPKDVAAAQRQMCVACHQPAACGLEEAARRAEEPADNCVVCHMPRGDTEIPHIAFVHHRIGRHDGPPAAPSEGTPALVPADDFARLPALERDRNLGLAYLAAANDAAYARYARPFRAQALELLESVHKAGLRDAVTSQALAELWWQRDRARTAAYAREALDAKDAPADTRALAMILLADGLMKERKFAAAAGQLEELATLRRYAEDWRLLGVCRLELDRPREALAAFQQALAIRPTRPDVHAALADAYRRLSDPARAAEHERKAQWLRQHRQE
jgi:predicted CXXCH cytochrome family protein